jgi:hypothetical protein
MGAAAGGGGRRRPHARCADRDRLAEAEEHNDHACGVVRSCSRSTCFPAAPPSIVFRDLEQICVGELLLKVTEQNRYWNEAP